MDLGSAGRGPNKKPSVPKAWRDLRKSSKKALKLFSSFLRGASCPKSPRFECDGVNGSLSQLHLLSDRWELMSRKRCGGRRCGGGSVESKSRDLGSDRGYRVRLDSGCRFELGGFESKPAPFENRKGAAPKGRIRVRATTKRLANASNRHQHEASQVGVRMRRHKIRSIVSRQPRGSNWNQFGTRPFVQYRFCLSVVHPQPVVNAGVILFDGGEFFSGRQE
jgi:hypothetical protein